MDIEVITFNCKGVIRSIQCIKALCARADIIALQETWLPENELFLLNKIHPDFQSVSISPSRTSEQRGPYQGGVDILWKKTLSATKLEFKSDRIIGIIVENRIIILCVYLPTKKQRKLLFSDILPEIETTLRNQCVKDFLIVGDFNIDFPKIQKMLEDFCLNQNAVCIDANDLPKETFTFIHSTHRTISWLDHCLISKNISELKREVNVIYDLFISDHFPLAIQIDFDEEGGNKKNIDTIFDKENTEIDIVKRSCIIENCKNNKANTDNSQCETPYHEFKEYVEDARVKARRCFQIWLKEGKQGPNSTSFENMFQSKTVFKKLFSYLYKDKNKKDFIKEHFNSDVADQLEKVSVYSGNSIDDSKNNNSEEDNLESPSPMYLPNDEKPSTSRTISPMIIPQNSGIVTSTKCNEQSGLSSNKSDDKRKKLNKALNAPKPSTFKTRSSDFICPGMNSNHGIVNSLPSFIMAVPPREKTFIMIKPDGVQRGLVGTIIKRFEKKGFKLVALKFMWPSEELLQKHYSDLASRLFFPGLVKYMNSGPVVPMVWEGLNVVKTGRQMLGATNPSDSQPGTIRGDLCIQVYRNIIHGSDSVEAANKEISLWFTEKELVGWMPADENWVYE